MTKIFKKPLAAILAVLMILTIIPTFSLTSYASETGSGSGTIYYNIKLKTGTSFSVGDQVLLAKSNTLANSNYAGFSLPTGFDARGNISNSIDGNWSTSYSPVYGIQLDLRSSDMDAHDGWIGWNGTNWQYHCTGNSDRGVYYAYTVDKSTFTASDVSVSEKTNVAGTVDKSNLQVNIAVPGKTITLSSNDFTMTDSSVNPSSGDCTYALNIAGVSITKFDGTKADSQIDSISGLTTAQSTELKNELANATNDTQVAAILEKAKAKSAATGAKTDIDNELQAKINSINALTNLTSTQKADFVAKAQKAASDAKTAIDKAVTTTDVSTQKATGISNIGKVLDSAKLQDKKNETSNAIDSDAATKKNAIDALTNLTDAEKAAKKNAIDTAASTAKSAINAATNSTGIGTAKTTYDSSASLIVDKAKAFDKINENLATAKEVVNNLSYLTDDEKNAVVEAITSTANNAKTNIESLSSSADIDTASATAVASINEDEDEAVAIDFIIGYLVDNNKDIYTSVDSDNIDKILSGQNTWEELTDTQRAIVNASIKSSTNDKYNSYEEYVLDCNDFVEKQANTFIKNYLTGTDSKIYKTATSKNYAQILNGKKDWDSMSQTEKDAINAKLVENGGKTYEELLADAKEQQKYDKNADSFISKYLTGKDGNVYKVATKDNYQQILSGKAAWDKLTQEEKDAINAKLVANGGKTYEKLLASAEKIKASIESPKTGAGTSLLAAMMFAMLFAGAGIIVITRKKETELEAE